MALKHRVVSVKLEKIRWWYRPERVDWNFWKYSLPVRNGWMQDHFCVAIRLQRDLFYSSKTEVDLCHTFIGTVPIYWLLSVQ